MVRPPGQGSACSESFRLGFKYVNSVNCPEPLRMVTAKTISSARRRATTLSVHLNSSTAAPSAMGNRENVKSMPPTFGAALEKLSPKMAKNMSVAKTESIVTTIQNIFFIVLLIIATGMNFTLV